MQPIKGKRRILNRRMALASAPLLFALLAGALGLRVRRESQYRHNTLLNRSCCLLHDLVAWRVARRVGSVSPTIGPWLATAVTLGVTILLLIKNRFAGFSLGRFGSGKEKKTQAVQKTGPSRAHAFG